MSMRNNFSRTHSSARIDAGVGIGPGGVNARYKGGISAFGKSVTALLPELQFWNSSRPWPGKVERGQD